MDYNKTICAYIVLDIIKSLFPEEKPEQDIFLLAISTLKKIETGNAFLELTSFILNFLNFSGFALNLIENDFVYFDKTNAEFTISRTENCSQIDKTVYQTLKKINNGETEVFNEKTLKQALRLLHNVIFSHFGVEIKSFEFI